MIECPICGKELKNETGMHLHMVYVHGASLRPKPETAHYDEATVEWCNQRSDENLLLRIYNQLDNLTFREARNAKKYGLTKLVSKGMWHGTKVILTPKAREILARINGGEE